MLATGCQRRMVFATIEVAAHLLFGAAVFKAMGDYIDLLSFFTPMALGRNIFQQLPPRDRTVTTTDEDVEGFLSLFAVGANACAQRYRRDTKGIYSWWTGRPVDAGKLHGR
ncbi:hypothetical protein PG993_005657 [Apiospora rasikravindrae]|uniref:Uncharacterized protein n=1 Tax=Apiospora rasikravindrae TaxID=990691 RepID=A0ABR1TIY5_9PEZI